MAGESWVRPVMPSLSTLPSELEHVPTEQRLPEAIGIGFAGVGAGALVVFIGYAVQLARLGLHGDTWKFAAGAAAIALGGVVIEVLRRRKPLTLVPSGTQIGVYKEGRLVSTFTMNQLTFFKLSFVNTFRELIIFGMFGAFATLGALGSVFS